MTPAFARVAAIRARIRTDTRPLPADRRRSLADSHSYCKDNPALFRASPCPVPTSRSKKPSMPSRPAAGKKSAPAAVPGA